MNEYGVVARTRVERRVFRWVPILELHQSWGGTGGFEQGSFRSIALRPRWSRAAAEEYAEFARRIYSGELGTIYVFSVTEA